MLLVLLNCPVRVQKCYKSQMMHLQITFLKVEGDCQKRLTNMQLCVRESRDLLQFHAAVE